MQRQRYSPFWVHEKLVPHSQYRTSVATICAAGEISCRPDTEPGALELDDGEDEEDEDDEDCEEDRELEDEDDETSKTDTYDIMSAVESLQDILPDSKEMGNTKFLEEFMTSNVSNGTLREIQERKRRRPFPKTWSSYKHSAVMYYR